MRWSHGAGIDHVVIERRLDCLHVSMVNQIQRELRHISILQLESHPQLFWSSLHCLHVCRANQFRIGGVWCFRHRTVVLEGVLGRASALADRSVESALDAKHIDPAP